ncbi:MAG TPA: zf-HC2 domain-containing protein [Thermoanaerobaculia bacterium]
MTCDEILERLPWLLNGTLDEVERRTVLEHLQRCANCRQALEETRLAWQVFDQHIPSEALVAYAYGEPAPGVDPGLVEAHLATCPQCAADLELARMSRRLEEDDRIAVMPVWTSRPEHRTVVGGWRAAALAAGLAGVVAASGWFQSADRARDLERQIAARPAEPAPVQPSTPPGPAPPAPGDDTNAERLAALEAQIERMRRTEAELREKEKEVQTRLDQLAQAAPAAPQVNTWSGDVYSSGDVVRGGEGEIQEIPAGSTAMLILHPKRGDGEKAREIEIADPQGKVVWKAEGLRLNAETRDYTITLPQGFLKPGAYTIRLYGTEGGKRAVVDTFEIRVR